MEKSKRKSDAYLAAEAVQQERDVLKALKRLSMSGSLTMDPDLPAEYDLQDYQKKQAEEEHWLHFVVELLQIDTEKLLWVPAKAHPSIAPDQFKRHVQSTLDDMTKKLHKKTNEPIPSLKELTDELDKLSEMAGLSATDAVSLARSLSSASSSSSFVYSPTSETSEEVNRQYEDEIDQDSPLIYTDSSNSLKRNKWTTYSRRRPPRFDKNKLHKDSLGKQSLLKNPPSNETSDSALQKQQQQQQQVSQKKLQHPYRPTQRSVSSSDDFNNRDEISATNLQRSQSDISSSSAIKRTNHARNRHTGSVIDLTENTVQLEAQSQSHEGTKELPQQSLVLPQHQPPQQRKVSPLSHEVQERPSLTSSSMLSKPDATVISQDVTEAPTPLGSPKEKEKEKSISKEFLNLFKMKRSPSPKLKESKKIITSSKTSVVDSISDSKKSPDDSQQQRSSTKEQKGFRIPSQKSGHLPFMKKDDKTKQQKTVQESVTVAPNEITQQDEHQSQKHKQQQQQQQQKQQHQRQYLAAQQHVPQHPQVHQEQASDYPGGLTEEQYHTKKESLARKLTECTELQRSTKPNAPIQFTDSAFGFPLPPMSRSTIVMLDYRFPVHVERALYRLSHLKLANPRRPLRQQVLLSNFMYAYLNLVNHTLYLQQLDEEQKDNAVTTGGGIDTRTDFH
ncbi:Protein ZDS1 AltName: Full=Protein NRC1; AltName: Full=RT2GS1 [Cyberlindnera jadinii]|uniref:ZDS1 protein n=1 Tax=Cyberlindnera jadinii (strain ATCC 18201 / CBS 1600 / BCRC 20928 / JCM 3617 / NBRC 0987 / NRRL Y-1542) TaxID=983966 RepID=A0A0H5CH57_CYBJN|nr:Protein ZDS1 AltName: Full=Protein NRC1; AltName: Full=RT2GS1 [Cyberlindnera jadinii]